MLNSNVYTEDFADIMSCSRERALVIEILQLWNRDGLPESFYEDEVKFAFNRNSGYVFLVNSEYQCLMVTDEGNLEEFYTSPYDGHEGFLSDLIEECDDDWHEDDIEWLEYLKASQ